MHDILFLSAGSGKRLNPYTINKPKCFVRYKKRSLIENQMLLLKNLPIHRIFIVYGKFHFLYKKLKATLIKNSKYKITNMVYSLYCAINEFNSNLIVSYTDINYSRRVIKKLFQENKYISVIIEKNWKNYWVKRSIDYSKDIESLKLNKSGFIVEIGGKIKKEKNDVFGQYIGLIKFPKILIKDIKIELKKLNKEKKIDDKKFDKAYLTDFLNYLAKNGYQIKPIFIHNDWIEIDTARDYKSMINSLRFKHLNNN